MKTLRRLVLETKNGKTAVLSYGRMNPPTIGHVKLADKIISLSKRQKADPFIFLSPSQNSKKDPLDPSKKIVYAKKILNKSIHIDIKPNIFKALSDLYSQGYRSVNIVVGSDRIKEFSNMIPKYNNVEGKAHGFYNFNNIEFQSSGDRDPDAEGVSGMSASKLRGFASSGDFDNFKKGTNLSDKDAKSMYNEIRKAMKIKTISESLKEEKNADDPDIPGHQPKKYGAGLSKSTKQKRYARWEKTKKMPDNSQRAYDLAKAPGDGKPSSKESKYTKRYKAMYGEETISEEQLEGLKKKSEKSGVPYGILKKVFNRGMAAWKTGHRPGTTPQQWAYARVNSFLTGGKTRTTADKDLWSKASSAKKAKKEEKDINLSFKKWISLSESDAYVSTSVGDFVVPKTSPKTAEINIKRKFNNPKDRNTVKARQADSMEKRYVQKVKLKKSGDSGEKETGYNTDSQKN